MLGFPENTGTTSVLSPHVIIVFLLHKPLLNGWPFSTLTLGVPTFYHCNHDIVPPA